jgi:hypothetical protein
MKKQVLLRVLRGLFYLAAAITQDTTNRALKKRRPDALSNIRPFS